MTVVNDSYNPADAWSVWDAPTTTPIYDALEMWGNAPSIGTTPGTDPYGWMEPDSVLSWIPGQSPQMRRDVNIPQYFTRPTTTLSPYANAVLANLFPTVSSNWQNMPTAQWIMSPATTDKEGNVTKEAQTGNTVITNPVLPSAQAYRRLQASGAMPQFQNYLGLVGQNQAPEAQTMYGEKVAAEAKGEATPGAAYLNKLAEDYKQAFLQQAQALWPMENKRPQVNWRVAKQ